MYKKIKIDKHWTNLSGKLNNWVWLNRVECPQKLSRGGLFKQEVGSIPLLFFSTSQVGWMLNRIEVAYNLFHGLFSWLYYYWWIFCQLPCICLYYYIYSAQGKWMRTAKTCQKSKYKLKYLFVLILTAYKNINN
jgi:hypothetical protein